MKKGFCCLGSEPTLDTPSILKAATPKVKPPFSKEGAEVCLNSLTFGQGGVDQVHLYLPLTSKTPSTHTLGQDVLFVATPVVDNSERAKNKFSDLQTRWSRLPSVCAPHCR